MGIQGRQNENAPLREPSRSGVAPASGGDRVTGKARVGGLMRLGRGGSQGCARLRFTQVQARALEDQSVASTADIRSPFAGDRALRGSFRVRRRSKRRPDVASFNKACLAQIARTCSSVANSPRAAAAFEVAIAARSSGESTTSDSPPSLPTSRGTMWAISS
jgi:hypothetical protein